MCHQSPKKSNLYQKKKKIYSHFTTKCNSNIHCCGGEYFFYVKICLKFDMGYARRCVEKFLLEFVCFKVVNMAAHFEFLAIRASASFQDGYLTIWDVSRPVC